MRVEIPNNKVIFVRSWDGADYSHIFNVDIERDSIIKKVKIHINVVPTGYEFDYYVEQRFLDEINKESDPLAFIRQNMWLLAKLKVYEFSSNLDAEGYNRHLSEIFNKWFR